MTACVQDANAVHDRGCSPRGSSDGTNDSPTRRENIRWKMPESTVSALSTLSTQSQRSSLSDCVLSEMDDSFVASEVSVSDVLGRVLSLSHSSEGTRLVQAVMEDATIEEIEQIASELRDHVVKVARCPHANHVLQRMITRLPAASLKFILDDLASRPHCVMQVSRHRYGCRILQHLLKKQAHTLMADVVDALLAQATNLSCHPFGTYVMQHLVQYGTEEQRYKLLRIMERECATFCNNPHGSGVIRAGFAHADSDDKVWLARALTQDFELLTSVAKTRYGIDVVPAVVQALHGQSQQRALRHLIEELSLLTDLPYIADVASYLEAHFSSLLG